MTITDEMIEAKAKEIYNDGAFHGHNKWLYADKEEREKWRKIAHAALEAALSRTDYPND